MKKTLLLLALFSAAAGSAQAADMPLKAPVAVPVWTWTGLYLGINAGWGEAKSSWCTEATLVTGCAGTDLVSQTGNSFVGGVQVEARYQWGNVVFGLGGDASLFNNSATSPAALPAGFPNRFRTTSFSDLYSVYGQLGYSLGSVLLYGKGGWAGAGMRYEANNTNLGGFNLSASTDVGGYVAGGGIDYMVTRNFVIGVEYDYYRFNVGAFNGLTNTGGVVIACAFCNTSESVQTVVGRASLKFGP
jgi:outer membrane immunogenic protein